VNLIFSLSLLVFGFFVQAEQTADFAASGRASAEQVPQLQGVGIIPHIGVSLDLGLKFQDEGGQTVSLGKYFKPGKPVIISPVYFGCRSLCNYHLNGLIDGLKSMDWSVGQKFDVVALSFDERETSELGREKKESYMRAYARPGTQGGFHFLTADKETIERVTEQLGFKFRWNPEMNEWAHPSAAIVVSPSGVITRYLPGVYFEARDIKLALNESVDGHLGTFVDRMVLYCFKYDEQKSKYTPYVLNIMKFGGVLIVLIMGVWLTSFWMRSRRQRMQKVSS
jgi:protein SCO1/2